MKVMWLTNTMPAVFSRVIGRPVSVFQGWVPSLAAAVRIHAPEIRLTIGCDGPNGAKSTVDGVDYFSIDCRRIRAEDLRRLVADIKPDLVHFHGSENIFPSFPRETWCGTPVVMSLQGVINGYYPHYMGDLLPGELKPYLGIVRRLGVGGGVARHADGWRIGMAETERRAFRNVSHVLGRTWWDRAWTGYLNPAATYHEVGELMRPEFHEVRRVPEAVVRHRIYCSAALGQPLKGGQWLLRAVAALRRKYPDVRLRIANGEWCRRPTGLWRSLRQPQYARYIWHLIEDLRIEDCVDLLPALSAVEVAEELRMAEVFCLPSLVENSPNSLGEAMLAGVPSVVTDVGGMTSMLKHAEEGLVVPSGDPAVLAAAIAELFDDPLRARQMGMAARARALATYSPARVVKQLLAAYESAIEEG